MNTRNTLRTLLFAIAALTALIGSAVAQTPVSKVTTVNGGRTTGPIQKVPLPLALPDLTFQAIITCSEGYNWREVVVVNNGNGYAPPTTMYMTWSGYVGNTFCAKFYPYAVKGLAPGETQAIVVDPGADCYQYASGSQVNFFLDYFNTIWESNKQNNSYSYINPEYNSYPIYYPVIGFP